MNFCAMSGALSPPRRPGYNDALRIARQNLDSHPNYILAVYMASGT